MVDYLSYMCHSFMDISSDSFSEGLRKLSLLPIRWSFMTFYYYKHPRYLSDFFDLGLLWIDNLRVWVPLPSVNDSAAYEFLIAIIKGASQ